MNSAQVTAGGDPRRRTLKPVEALDPPPPHAADLAKPSSDFPGLAARWQGDAGTNPDHPMHDELRWEPLPTNRDQPRPRPWPPPTLLRVYAFGEGD